MKNYYPFLCLCIAVCLLSCGPQQNAEVKDQVANAATTTATSETQPEESADLVGKKAPLTKLPLEFPQAFKDLSIPEFKNVTYERAFRHNHATTPKIQVGFSTPSSPTDIEAFYIKSLEKQGWTKSKVNNNPKQKEGVRISIFKKDNKQLVLNAIPHPKDPKTIATMILFDI